MSWDVELEIPAPAGRIFSILAEWYRHEELIRLASVQDYSILLHDGRCEYFSLKVRDLPFKSSYCYGKRMMRRPDIILTVFTYRFFKSKALVQPAELEKRMQTDWEKFFFQTARCTILNPGLTLLRVNEPGSEPASGKPLGEIRAFYEKLGEIAAGDREEPDTERAFDEGEDAEARQFSFPVDEGKYDPYAILGINPTATFEIVKRAFRRQALLWHPDKFAASDKSRVLYAHNRFIEITAAYHTILRARGY